MPNLSHAACRTCVQYPVAPETIDAGGGLVLERADNIEDYLEEFTLLADPANADHLRFLALVEGYEIEDAHYEHQVIAAKRERGEAADYKVILRGQRIGTVGYDDRLAGGKAYINYLLVKAAAGRGLARRAVAALISTGFNNLEIETFKFSIHPANMRSVNLASGLGAEFSHSFIADNRDADPPREEPRSIYDLHKSAWEAAHASV